MIKLFVFIKDEIEIIEDWLRYHCDIFGAHNITVIDHMSTDGTTLILDKWKHHGLTIHSTSVPFRDKHKMLTAEMIKHKKGFLVPLDADEFITLKEGDQITCKNEKILGEFNRLQRGSFRYKFQQIDAVPSLFRLNDPLIEIKQFNSKWYQNWKTYAKTFYDAAFFINTDQGNHKGLVKGHGNNIETNLTIVHYDVRDYDHFVKKNERGAKAYGHTSSKNLTHGIGKHYHRRYWAIKEGRGIQQMINEFGNTGNFSTNAVSEKILNLR